MRVVCILLTILTLVSCQSWQAGSESKSNSKEYLGLQYKTNWKEDPKNLSFMTFNVENLFDSKDDPGKNDETYLPLNKKQSKTHKKSCKALKNSRWRDQCLNWDWSKKVVTHKLKVISNVIKQVENGKGPDILVLQEIENLNILNQLNSQGLNYPTVVLIEGADKRGIDVALLSRLPLHGESQLHSIPFKGFGKKRVQDTRGILQVDLKLPDKKILTIFGVHFPAPYHPKKMREQAFMSLNRLKQKLPTGRLALAAGDFNIPKREDKKFNLVNNLTKKDWVVGHKVACKGCPGSTYYPPKNSWSFLDMILWSSSFDELNSSWKVLKDSFRVANKSPEQMTVHGAPHRYDMKTLKGVSDHWPLVVELRLKK